MSGETDIAIKKAVIEQARVLYRAKLAHPDQAEEATCLQWAVAVIWACHLHDIRALIQAGTASWRFVPEEEDDGARSLYFSYTFDIRQANLAMALGIYPEMHCWAGIPDTGEIIDITTQYQDKQLRKMLGEDWHPDLALPEYLWTRKPDIDCQYSADEDACRLAMEYIKHAALR